MTPSQLTQFTIYDHPRDFPFAFVVREWHVTALGARPGRTWRADTLEEARGLIPLGMFCLGREPGDDPTIVETWT